MPTEISVNDARHTVDAAPDTPLLYVLAGELELKGPRFGCGLAQCGSCSVLIEGVETRSCVTLLSAVGTRSNANAPDASDTRVSGAAPRTVI